MLPQTAPSKPKSRLGLLPTPCARRCVLSGPETSGEPACEQGTLSRGCLCSRTQCLDAPSLQNLLPRHPHIAMHGDQLSSQGESRGLWSSRPCPPKSPLCLSSGMPSCHPQPVPQETSPARPVTYSPRDLSQSAGHSGEGGAEKLRGRGALAGGVVSGLGQEEERTPWAP